MESFHLYDSAEAVPVLLATEPLCLLPVSSSCVTNRDKAFQYRPRLCARPASESIILYNNARLYSEPKRARQHAVRCR